MSEGDTEAEHLLELELDGGADLLHLGGEVVTVVDDGGELADLVEGGTKNTGDLLDKALRGEESIVLLGCKGDKEGTCESPEPAVKTSKKRGEARTEVLDKLLVLVELLKVIHGHELETGLLGLIAVESVSENADGELGAGDVGELDAAGETLVLLGIVVLEADLELDSLSELLLVLLGVLEEAVDGLKENFAGNLAALRKKENK